MNPILLYTDTDKIAGETNFYNEVVPYFQNMYNALQLLGITPTLQDLSSFSQWIRQQNGTLYIENYVTDKLVAQAGGANFNGVPINAAKLKELIVVPDLTSLISVTRAGQIFSQEFNGINIAYLQITNNVISLDAGTAAAITAKWSYYTTTDAGTTKATGLQAICDTLNAYDAANDNQFYTGVANNTFYDQKVKFPLPGLDIRGGQFVVSVSYIADFEANN